MASEKPGEVEVVQEEIVILPFDLEPKKYKPLLKLPSVKNWKVKSDKRFNNGLVVEVWNPVGKAEFNSMGYKKGNSGYGVSSGVKSGVAQKFEKTEYLIKESHYDETCDSWIMKDKDGVFHRLAWANAYRNENYPMHKDREEVHALIASCNNVKIY